MEIEINHKQMEDLVICIVYGFDNNKRHSYSFNPIPLLRFFQYFFCLLVISLVTQNR